MGLKVCGRVSLNYGKILSYDAQWLERLMIKYESYYLNRILQISLRYLFIIFCNNFTAVTFRYMYSIWPISVGKVLIDIWLQFSSRWAI